MLDGAVQDRLHIGPADILTALPHRGAALFPAACWFDGADGGAIRGGGSAAWDAAHPVLQGHFPQLAIVPGVFLLEAAAQIAGVLVWAANDNRDAAQGRIGVLSSLKKSLIHAPVLPGQRIDYQLELRRVGADFYQVAGVGMHGERKAVTLELTLSVVDPARLTSTI